MIIPEKASVSNKNYTKKGLKNHYEKREAVKIDLSFFAVKEMAASDRRQPNGGIMQLS